MSSPPSPPATVPAPKSGSPGKGTAPNPPSSSTSTPPPSPPAISPPPSSPSSPPPSTPAIAPSPPASSPPPALPSPSPPSPPPSSTPPSSPIALTPPSPPSPPTSEIPSTPAVGRSPPSPDKSPAASSGSLPSRASPSSPPSGSSSISTGMVVGIAVVALAAVALLGMLCFCCKKKKRRFRFPVERHGVFKDDLYVQRPKAWDHNDPHIPNRASKLPPPPPYASRPFRLPAWLQRPPPPPPIISSSVMESGSNSSGPDVPLPSPSSNIPLGFYRSTFTYEELVTATDGFSDANFLGQGGFGYVHKGVFTNGKEVAIKQLKTGSGQGQREFQAEVEIISRVHHKHLVSLVGYCIFGVQRLLVYEFVPNRTLDFHLHGKGQPTMDWSTRLKIALGAAKGLAYLHEDCYPKIIHRDIKAANILLDFKFVAKVADFGLAKFASDNNTHVSTRVMGTFGYLAPEYASTGKLTDKSDVFSFGVVLLELLTGKCPTDMEQSASSEDSLVDWARPLMAQAMEHGSYAAIIDRRLGNNYNLSEAARMVACAAACVRHSARRRPRMNLIVRVLEGDITLDDLNEGIMPGHSSAYGSTTTDDGFASSRYSEAIKRFKKMSVAGGGDHTASGSSNPTSEYGLNPSASSSEGRRPSELEVDRANGPARQV